MEQVVYVVDDDRGCSARPSGCSNRWASLVGIGIAAGLADPLNLR